MDERVLEMWKIDTCYGVRLDVWLPSKVIAQAAEIARLNEIIRKQAETIQHGPTRRYLAWNMSKNRREKDGGK